MIASILFGVLVVVFLVLAYLGSKTWPVMHIVLLTSFFLLCIGFVFLAALTLKTQSAWEKLHLDLSTDLERTLAEVDRLENGAEGFPGRIRLVNELGRTLLDRGRVWRGAIPNGIAARAVTIDLADWKKNPCVAIEEEGADLEPIAQEDAGDGAQPAAAPHGLEPNQVVYLFQETSISKLSPIQKKALFGESNPADQMLSGRCKLPSFYLGEFQVTEVNGTNVTLVSVRPLDASQQQILTDQQGTWVVYDLLPIDDPDLFGNMTVEEMASLIPGASIEDVENFVRHGKKAKRSDPLEHKLFAVKFLKNYSIEVDDPNADVGAERSFGPSGRAQSSVLRQGGETTFKKGDRAVFDGITADRLKKQGIVEQLNEEPVFRRPLVDYAFLFKQRQIDLDRLSRQMAIFQADNGSLIASAERVESEITYREKERQGLQSDLKQFRNELDRATRFRTQLQTKRDRQREILSSLYRSNNSRARQLQLRSGDSKAMLGSN